jgi:CBS domain containing-hemolysin-like protein
MGLRDTGAENSLHSVEELLLLVEDTEEAGMIGPEQAEFVENVFLLSNKLVADIMVPRGEVAALDIATPPGKILELVRSGAHTRLPVYQDNLDHIVGIVNTKDLFTYLAWKALSSSRTPFTRPCFCSKISRSPRRCACSSVSGAPWRWWWTVPAKPAAFSRWRMCLRK